MWWRRPEKTYPAFMRPSLAEGNLLARSVAAEQWWFSRNDSWFLSVVPVVSWARTAPPNAGQCRWRMLRSTSSSNGSESWLGAKGDGEGVWLTGACGSRVGQSTTSGCKGSGVRKGSSGPCSAGGNAPDKPGADANCCGPNTRTMCGQSTFSSTRRWMAVRSSS